MSPPPRIPIRGERFDPLATSRPQPLERLGPRRCKWPIGDWQTPGLTCCGAPAPDGGPYCAPHETMNRDPKATRAWDRLNVRKRRIGT